MLETCSGIGDAALLSMRGLLSQVSSLTKDPYVSSLQTASEENAADKDKVSLALLLATQLCGYLEGQTGLVSVGGRGGDQNIQTAPSVTINHIHGLAPDQIGKITDIVERTMDDGKPS